METLVTVLRIIAFVLLGLFVIEEIVWLFIGTKRIEDDKINWLIKKPIAHRGLHNDECLENTKAAFLNAIEHNFNIETDLNITKDNKVVVFHDSTLYRMCGVNKTVCDLTLEELKTYKLLNSEETILELKEFLDLVDGRTGLLIEFKSVNKDLDNKLCIAAMEILNDYHGDYAIQSFQPQILKFFKKNYPDIARGQISFKYTKKDGDDSLISRWAFTNHFANIISRPHFILRRYSDINLVTKFLAKNSPLLCWTIQSNQEYIKIKDKCDNIIFENLTFEANDNGK